MYAVAEHAYRAMLSTQLDQAVLVSGESGAGKTEAAKKVMEYVAAVSGDKPSLGTDVNIKERLLLSNPVLEAFGNAKTCRNDNSSRFGKYMQLLFDYAGVPVGGRLTNYLLEKPRVVTPGQGEQSFHVFYQRLYLLWPCLPQASGASTSSTSFYTYYGRAYYRRAELPRLLPTSRRRQRD